MGFRVLGNVGRAQYPLAKEYTSNQISDPFDLRYSLRVIGLFGRFFFFFGGGGGGRGGASLDILLACRIHLWNGSPCQVMP